MCGFDPLRRQSKYLGGDPVAFSQGDQRNRHEPPPPPPERRWGVWANGWGDWVTVDNDNFAKGYNFTTGGFIIGVDYRVTDHFAVGLMGSYAYSRGNLQPSGNIDTNTGRKDGLRNTCFVHLAARKSLNHSHFNRRV